MDYIFGARFEPQPEGGFVVSFPDVPEAITQGEDVDDARSSAAEVLGFALRFYLSQGRALPQPKATGKGLIEVPLDAGDALKIAVIEAFLNARISKAEFARKLGKGETEAYRILDPDHPTKLTALEKALTALGKQVIVSVRDAA